MQVNVLQLQKLIFRYDWFDIIQKSHAWQVGFEDFYCSLKTVIEKDEYEQFLKMFNKNYYTTMGDWLQVYNVEDVETYFFRTC